MYTCVCYCEHNCNITFGFMQLHYITTETFERDHKTLKALIHLTSMKLSTTELEYTVIKARTGTFKGAKVQEMLQGVTAAKRLFATGVNQKSSSGAIMKNVQINLRADQQKVRTLLERFGEVSSTSDIVKVSDRSGVRLT